MTVKTSIKLAPDGRIVGRLEIDSEVPPEFVEVAPETLDAGPKPSACHVLYWTGTSAVWVDPRSVEVARQERWAQLKAHRQGLDEQPIAVGDFTVDGDAQSRQDIMGAVMAMQLTGQTERAWRCADNVMRTLSFADLVAAGTAIAARRQALIETSDALWQQIQAATTVEAVQAVAWPAANGN